jgi:SOS-response transcriptional repressor LexA
MAKKSVKSSATEAKAGKKTRPTKKQHETLNFIRHFISEHGYSPSYREIMNGCEYTSVATVSLHVNSLMKRGHIVKRDKSARSLEVVSGIEESPTAQSNHKHELMKEIDARFKQLEVNVEEEVLNEVYVLVGALKILGHQEVAVAYAGRINELQA